MRSKLTQTTPPSGSVVTLAEVKEHLRIDGTDEDTYLGRLITVATNLTENLTGRALLRASYRLEIDDYRDVELPKPPFNAIDSVTYVDVDGQTQTLASGNYRADTSEEPAVIEFIDAKPSTQLTNPRPIAVNYSTGYADANAVPQMIKQYVLMAIGTIYDTSRSSNSEYKLHEAPMSRALIAPYIVVEREDESA